MRVGKHALAIVLVAGAAALAMPASPAQAVPVFPGNPGHLRVTFDNTGAPGFHTGPGATGAGALRMDTGSGSGPSAGGKVFLHSDELDGSPLSALASWSFQYRIDPGSPSSFTPFVDIRVNNPEFGNRTLGIEPSPGVVGSFETVTVPTGATDAWQFAGAPPTCGGTPVPVSAFSLDDLELLCPAARRSRPAREVCSVGSWWSPVSPMVPGGPGGPA